MHNLNIQSISTQYPPKTRQLLSLLVGGIVLLTPFATKIVLAQPSNLPAATPAQQQQRQQLLTQVRTQIQTILTAEQRSQVQTAVAQGELLPTAIATLNLSDAQKIQIQNVLETSRQQLVSSLPADRRPAAFPALNLTDTQKVQAWGIGQQVLTQVQALLTPAQKNQLKTAIQNGGDLRSAIATVNLTASQKTAMRDILKSTKSQFDQVLTPEQQQQMQQTRRAWIQSLNPEQRQKLREKLQNRRSSAPGL